MYGDGGVFAEKSVGVECFLGFLEWETTEDRAEKRDFGGDAGAHESRFEDVVVC